MVRKHIYCALERVVLKARFRIYSWSPYTPDPDHKYPNMQFMAQLWGPDQVDDWESVVQAGYANFALGMNECVHWQECYALCY